MHLHHDSVRLGRRFLKNPLQHVQHELHGGVVVVEQDDLEEGRLFLLGLDPFLDDAVGLILAIAHAVWQSRRTTVTTSGKLTGLWNEAAAPMSCTRSDSMPERTTIGMPASPG